MTLSKKDHEENLAKVLRTQADKMERVLRHRTIAGDVCFSPEEVSEAITTLRICADSVAYEGANVCTGEPAC